MTPNGSTFANRQIVINAAAGNVITAICIKSGSSTFAQGGSGTGANSTGGGDDAGTSDHSLVIDADGTYRP